MSKSSKRERGAPNAGTFQKGNKAAIGNKGPGSRHRFLTEALIAQLNELDPKTRKEKFHKLVEITLKKAFKGDGDMIKYIWDRIEGKIVAVPAGEGGEGGVHVHVTVEGGLPDDV